MTETLDYTVKSVIMKEKKRKEKKRKGELLCIYR